MLCGMCSTVKPGTRSWCFGNAGVMAILWSSLWMHERVIALTPAWEGYPETRSFPICCQLSSSNRLFRLPESHLGFNLSPISDQFYPLDF